MSTKKYVTEVERKAARCESTRRYRQRHPERVQTYKAARRLQPEARLKAAQSSARHRNSWSPEKRAEKRRQKLAYVRGMKLEAIKAYGSKCECCGEEHWQFLTLDHLNQDGATRRSNGEPQGQSFYRLLRDQGWPKGFLRVLCIGCNFSIGQYGYCPHDADAREKDVEWFSGELESAPARKQIENGAVPQ